jgi:hypothetical protein
MLDCNAADISRPAGNKNRHRTLSEISIERQYNFYKNRILQPTRHVRESPMRNYNKPVEVTRVFAYE